MSLGNELIFNLSSSFYFVVVIFYKIFDKNSHKKNLRMENTNADLRRIRSVHGVAHEDCLNREDNRYEWHTDGNTVEAVKVSLNYTNPRLIANNNATISNGGEGDEKDDEVAASDVADSRANNGQGEGSLRELCQSDKYAMQATLREEHDENENNRHIHHDDNENTTRLTDEERNELQQETNKMGAIDSGIASISSVHNNTAESTLSIQSIGSFVCRICHNAEQPDRLVSPCLCKGSLMYVHIYCLEHWISTSGKTTCELCQFRYKTVQTLRYTCLQSLRMWYSHSMSRRALQEDCQMFSLLTLVAFGIVGTIFVGIQYYVVQEKHHIPTMTRMYTKSWLLFFLVSTFVVYFVNVYMIVRGQLAPWYRWWQSAREIKLILENRKTANLSRRLQKPEVEVMTAHLQDACRNAATAAITTTTPTVTAVGRQEVAADSVFLNLYVSESGESENQRNVLLSNGNESDDMPPIENDNEQQCQQLQQSQQQQQDV